MSDISLVLKDYIEFLGLQTSGTDNCHPRNGGPITCEITSVTNGNTCDATPNPDFWYKIEGASLLDKTITLKDTSKLVEFRKMQPWS